MRVITGPVRMLRTEKTNDPALIARQPRMVSVNGAPPTLWVFSSPDPARRLSR
jgi:hypothetical protein